MTPARAGTWAPGTPCRPRRIEQRATRQGCGQRNLEEDALCDSDFNVGIAMAGGVK